MEEMNDAISKSIPDKEREHKEAIYRELGLPVRALRVTA